MSSYANHGTDTVARTSTVRRVAQIVGATFILVGILGFIPGITTHYSDLSFAGPDSQAKLLGLFEVSVLHNIVHLVFGGLIYLLLVVFGLIVDENSTANVVPVNTADNWLHLLLGLGMVGLGLGLKNRRARVAGGERA